MASSDGSHRWLIGIRLYALAQLFNFTVPVLVGQTLFNNLR